MTSRIIVNNIQSDAGISTIFFNSDIGATSGTLNLAGNLNVSGVVTYEDVTNIDSVGVITARSGLQVTGGNVGIGTDNPGAKTHIDSTTSNTPLVVEASQNNRSRIVFRNNVETGTECNIELFDDDLRFVTNSGERLRITSDGKFGLGLNPSMFFEVYSQSENDIARFSGPNSGNIVFRNDTSNEIQIHTGTSDSLIFGTNGENERLRISSAGDITLGYSGSSLYFQNGFNDSTSRIQNGGGSNNSELKFLVRNAGTESEKMRLTSTAGLSIATAGSVLANAGNETLFIQGEGHNGHGTSNTRSVVSIVGAHTSNNAGMGIWIGTRTNENTAIIGTRTASGNLAVETYNGGWGERLRITSKGCLLINSTNDAGELQGSVSSTSAGNDLSSTTLDLSSGISGFNARESGNQANSGVGYWFNHGGLKAGIAVTRNVTNQWGTRMSFYTHKSSVSDIHQVYERMRINPDGEIQMYQVYSTGVSGSVRDLHVQNNGMLGYSASIRAAKTNITSLSDVNWLYNLNPVSFNYREKNEETKEYLDTHHSETEYGLIAEEVESINSDLVFYDEVDGEQELRGVHYKKLVPALLKAVQDLKARVTTLEGS